MNLQTDPQIVEYLAASLADAPKEVLSLNRERLKRDLTSNEIIQTIAVSFEKFTEGFMKKGIDANTLSDAYLKLFLSEQSSDEVRAGLFIARMEIFKSQSTGAGSMAKIPIRSEAEAQHLMSLVSLPSHYLNKTAPSFYQSLLYFSGYDDVVLQKLFQEAFTQSGVRRYMIAQNIAVRGYFSAEVQEIIFGVSSVSELFKLVQKEFSDARPEELEMMVAGILNNHFRAIRDLKSEAEREKYIHYVFKLSASAQGPESRHIRKWRDLAQKIEQALTSGL